MRRLLLALALLALVGIAAAPVPGSAGLLGATPAVAGSPTVKPIPTDATMATVERVIDGDTITVEIGGQEATVRLILIDTPETKKPGSPIECFGPEAAVHTKALLPEGTAVYLERDVSETDRYGRLLRYVWVPTGGARLGYLLDERLVREGYAALSTYPPDVKYVERIRAAQQAAVRERAGLWRACGGTNTPRTAPAGGPLPSSVAGSAPALPGADRDCSDFATQADAQAFYETAGGPAADPHKLDADHNGLACESLP